MNKINKTVSLAALSLLLSASFHAIATDAIYQFPFKPGKDFCVKPIPEPKSDKVVRFMMPEGEPILAARAGIVKYVRTETTKREPIQVPGLPHTIIIVDHLDGTIGQYFPIRGEKVKAGDKIKAGDQIAETDDTFGPGGDWVKPGNKPNETSTLVFLVMRLQTPNKFEAVDFKYASPPKQCK